MVWIKSIKLVCILKQTWMCKKSICTLLQCWKFQFEFSISCGTKIKVISYNISQLGSSDITFVRSYDSVLMKMKWDGQTEYQIRVLFLVLEFCITNKKNLLTILLNWNIRNLLLLPTLPITPAKPSIYILGYIMKCEVSVILL